MVGKWGKGGGREERGKEVRVGMGVVVGVKGVGVGVVKQLRGGGLEGGVQEGFEEWVEVCWKWFVEVGVKVGVE
ncbi:hypothetical protein [Kocuria rhizophila]|uniref:hypothetical protein n=1 Tax=Kocuria rhizophila TaxID=72000 RepID=UPI001642B7D0|nr:hypothetical protein [Kocuria rhizophila]